jgi:hypothetical protein
MDSSRLLAIIVAALCLGACSSIVPNADQFAAAEDADCKAYGEPETHAYKECRKAKNRLGACRACDSADPVVEGPRPE